MAGLDDFMSWLMGGTQLGNFLGVSSPTASTQTPALPATAAASPAAPTLGGQLPPPQGGLLSGLLGSQQPANPMSYFMPQQGLLGNSPLGMGLRGGLAGLAQGAGYGGLSGLGMGAMGGQQEEMQRRQNQMNTVLAGQQYQKGQQDLISGNLNNQIALMRANGIRRAHGLSDLTMNDLITNPYLVTNPLAAQPTPAPGAPPVQTATATPAVPGPKMQPIVTGQPINPQVAAAYGGLGSGGVTDPSRGSSWGAPSGVQDPTLTTPAPVSPPIAVTGQPQQPVVQQPQQTTTAPAQQPQQPAATGTTSGETDIYAARQADINAEMENAFSPEEIHHVQDKQIELDKDRAATAQAVQTAQATADANWQGPADTYKRIMDLKAGYLADNDYKMYHDVLPFYQSGMAAFKARDNRPGAPATSDFDLVNAVLHMANPNAGNYRPGSAISATDLATIPAEFQASIQKMFNDKTALDAPTAQRLADSLQRNMAPRQAAYDRLVGVTRAQVQAATPQGMTIPEVMWRSDMPAPPPPTAPGKIQGKPVTMVLQNGTYDYTTGKWVWPQNPQWLPQ